jgi:hypothetical protein
MADEVYRVQHVEDRQHQAEGQLRRSMTFFDYARWRLSVFSREEANAIEAYLEFKRDLDPDVIDRPAIDTALNSIWLERARTAPQARSLEQHMAEQKEYLAAIRPEIEEGIGEQ